jgi:hypothetical protein
MSDHDTTSTDSTDPQPGPDSWATDRTAGRLAAGGFTPATEVMTTTGPVAISELEPGTSIYALDTAPKHAVRTTVTGIDRVAGPHVVVRIDGQRTALAVAPGHRILWETRGSERVQVQRAGRLAEQRRYKLPQDWACRWGRRLATVDITDLLSDYQACATADVHGHTFRAALPDGCEPVRSHHGNYFFDAATFEAHQAAIEDVAVDVIVQGGVKHRKQPYRFDGDDFLALLGWYATEGSVTWKDDRDTAEIRIAQRDAAQRAEIEALFDRLDIDTHSDDAGVRFGSALFGRLLERLCGPDAHHKRLPAFVFETSRAQREHLLGTLLAGDGNARGTYYTASDELLEDVLQLCLSVGIKPRYRTRRGTHQVHVREVYDGFGIKENVALASYAGPLYRLEVADHPAVLAGLDGRFQWVGTSRVS